MAGRFDANERRALVLSSVGHFGAHFAMLLFPTLAVFIAREEGIPLETVLGWSFAGYFLFGFGSLPVGILADRYRSLPVLRVGVVATGLATMAVGLASGGRAVAASLALVGAAASMYHPAGMALLSRAVRARGTAMGINGVFGGLGIASAPIMAEAAARLWGWRGAYLVLGGAMVVVGVAVALSSIDEARPPRPTGPASAGQRERWLLFALLLVAMTLGGFSYRGSTVGQPVLYAERLDFVGHGVATRLACLSGTVGQYVGGRLADRFDLRWLYILFHAASIPFLAAMAYLSGLPVMVAGAGYVLFGLGQQPIENSLIARFTPDHWRATGYALKFAVTFGVGALAVPLIEHFVEAGRLSSLFLVLAAVVGGIATIGAALAYRTRGRPIYNLSAG